MNPILENIITRRSCRKFIDKKISKEDLDLILQAATFAPSAMNHQSWQFTVIQNKEKIQMLAKAVREALNRGNEYNFYDPDTFILVSNEKENSNGLADSSCALQNIFLMAHSLGIASCWINQLKTICDEPEIRKILNDFGVPENHIVWGSAALGYAFEESTAPKRKNGTIKFVD